MPQKSAPEFSYDPKTKLYHKRVKNEKGEWRAVYGHTKQELREKVKIREEQVQAAIRAQECPACYEYAAAWFARWSPGKGAKNIESTRSAINNHIMPTIGSKAMIDVTEDDLKDVLNTMAGDSKALNTKVLRVMKWIFHAAVKDGTIASDPAEDLKPGGTPATEKIPLTEAQQRALIGTVEGLPIYPFVMIGLFSGLRREEILGLQWDCVHLDDAVPYLSVRRAWRWEKNKAVVSDTLKSKASSRDIPLPPQLVETLKLEQGRSSGDYVLGGKKPWTQNQFRQKWKAIDIRTAGSRPRIDRHGKPVLTKDGKPVIIDYKVGDKIPRHDCYITIDFDVTPHILRHTYITRLILSGANIKTVQYLAGHADVSVTLNIYTKLVEHAPSVTASEVLQAFGAPKAEPTAAPEISSTINSTGKKVPDLVPSNANN